MTTNVKALNRGDALFGPAQPRSALRRSPPPAAAGEARLPQDRQPALLRRVPGAIVRWIVRAQQARADAQLMRMARLDPRVMAELDAARLRAERDEQEASHE